MNLFEIIKNAPETSQLITDSIVITHSDCRHHQVPGSEGRRRLHGLCQHR